MADQQEIGDSGAVQLKPEPTKDMELETAAKREREEEEEDEIGGVSKKPKAEGVEKSVEEQRVEKEKVNGSVRAKLGPKEFVSSVEMFDYFVKLLHFWPTDLDINKYEHMVLLDLIKKGHSEPNSKIGGGVKAFQIRNHPVWKSRCFFVIREDDTTDAFSFRKCVDHILPLPENMKAPKFSSRGGGGGRGGGRGGGKFRK